MRAVNSKLLPCWCCRASTAGSTQLWGPRGTPRFPCCCSTSKVKCCWGGGEGGRAWQVSFPAWLRGIPAWCPELVLLPFCFPAREPALKLGGAVPQRSIRPGAWMGPFPSPWTACWSWWHLHGPAGAVLVGRDGRLPLERVQPPASLGQASFAAALLLWLGPKQGFCLLSRRKGEHPRRCRVGAPSASGTAALGGVA